MKWLQYLLSVMFVLAGIALLCAPEAHAAGFAPTRFTVVDEGKAGAPDVVLIPGLASSREVWANEAKLLAPNYRVHLVQVDGFAGQAAGPNASGEILPALVEELHQYIAASGMKPVVVGHSLGGLLTLELAAKYPADVRKIVVVDSLPFYGQLFDANATAESLKPQAVALKAQMMSMPEEQYAAMQQMMMAQMVKDPAGQKEVASGVASSDRAVVMEAMLEDMTTDDRAAVAGIKVPALILFAADTAGQGARGPKYEAAVRESYKAMPNATIVKVEDSRHFIMYDQPAKLDAALEGFLK